MNIKSLETVQEAFQNDGRLRHRAYHKHVVLLPAAYCIPTST